MSKQSVGWWPIDFKILRYREGRINKNKNLGEIQHQNVPIIMSKYDNLHLQYVALSDPLDQ